jgi:hypothetical protein
MPAHLDLAGSAETRGTQRGVQSGEELRRTLALYSRIFHAIGISQSVVREHAMRVAETVAQWNCRYVDEMDAVARAASVQEWQIYALNARTEIAAQGQHGVVPECSTLVELVRNDDTDALTHTPIGAQTWDWHHELAHSWHTQSVHGTEHSYVGLTEYGIVSKIGLNSAGVGVLFNILAHQHDSTAGIPMHLLSADILGNAGSVEDAVDILRSAPIASSSAFTVLDNTTMACAEVSPAGVAELQPSSNSAFIAHTNHFLDARNRELAKDEAYILDSVDRWNLLAQRHHARSGPISDIDDVVASLRSGEGEPLLCRAPDPSAGFGENWTTLATVTIEPAARRMQVLAGMPTDAGSRAWIELTP